jgi:hypothetical protein
MSKGIIEKLDRLGKEAGIQEMTPEIRRFALLVRSDMASGWAPMFKQMVDAETLASYPGRLKEKKND